MKNWWILTGRFVLSLHQQHPGNQESQGGLAHPLRCSISNVGWEQRPELWENQLQPLEPALPQAAAEPHAVRVQGAETVQYPLGSTAGCVRLLLPWPYLFVPQAARPAFPLTFLSSTTVELHVPFCCSLLLPILDTNESWNGWIGRDPKDLIPLPASLTDCFVWLKRLVFCAFTMTPPAFAELASLWGYFVSPGFSLPRIETNLLLIGVFFIILRVWASFSSSQVCAWRLQVYF